ncbi:MAG: hypothetical protein GF350_07045 [Chitinivibrionales bacterium]|nr:hypothetical protein [Chitinivibrionales bacterium]
MPPLIAAIFIICCCVMHTACQPYMVACVGNSITEGWGTSNHETYSYPAQLQTMLGYEYQVEKFAKSGATLMRETGSLPYWDQFEFEAVLNSGADIITVMLGTNDLGYWYNSSNTFDSDLAALVDTFLQIESHPLVCLCLPPTSTLDNKAMEMDSVFFAVAARKQVPLFDTQIPLLAQSSYFSDGVHLSDSGAACVARIIHDGITGAVTRWGCTDPQALNYDMSMLWDDGSCRYGAGTIHSLSHEQPVQKAGKTMVHYSIAGRKIHTAGGSGPEWNITIRTSENGTIIREIRGCFQE